LFRHHEAHDVTRIIDTYAFLCFSLAWGLPTPLVHSVGLT